MIESKKATMIESETESMDEELALSLQRDELNSARSVVHDVELSLRLQLEDLELRDQVRRDRQLCERETNEAKVDLDRRIYDRTFAKQVDAVPDKRWRKQGSKFQKPYSLGYSSIEGEKFRLYCKGIVSEELVGDTRKLIGGVGLAISDSEDNRIWEANKVLGADESTNQEVAELAALFHGLSCALELDLGKITFFCDDSILEYLTGATESEDPYVSALIKDVSHLQTKFTFCRGLSVRSDISFVLKLARDAINAQIRWTDDSNKFVETCAICFEPVPSSRMFVVNTCFHRFCSPCMKRHLDNKVLDGSTLSCPTPMCQSEVPMDACSEFLDPKLLEVLKKREKESQIDVSDRVFCPDPSCSALMSKPSLLKQAKTLFANAKDSGARKCIKCSALFCIKCSVKWHSDMSCKEFKNSKTYKMSEMHIIQSKAQREGWKRCHHCNSMVERAEGCSHIICRCKYEFCYTCGAEWKKKKATCNCPLRD